MYILKTHKYKNIYIKYIKNIQCEIQNYSEWKGKLPWGVQKICKYINKKYIYIKLFICIIFNIYKNIYVLNI